MKAYVIQRKHRNYVAASKQIGLEVNVNNNYRVISRDKNAGRSRNMKIDNNFFERVEEFKYFGRTLNSVALVRTRTIPTERPPPIGEVSANFCG